MTASNLTRWRRLILVATLLPLVAGCQGNPIGQRTGDGARAAAGDDDRGTARLQPTLQNRQYAPDAQITSGNVGDLRQAWQIPTRHNVSHTPLVRDGQVYFADWGGIVYCVDAASGEIRWQKQVEKQPKTDWPWHGFPGTGALGPDMLFEASAEGTAYGIDLSSGNVRWTRKFVEQGQEAGNAGTMLYHDGLVYIGVCSVEEMLDKMEPDFKPDFQGKVVALDATTGSIVWERRLAEPPSTGAAVWSAFALEPESNTLFVTTSNSYTKPASKRSDAFVALNAKSGEIRWTTQVTENDVWTMGRPIGPDYAFAGGPQLFEAAVDGKSRRLLGAGQKSGTYFALDRKTGEVVWTSVIGYGGFGGGIMGEAAVGDRRIYVQSNNNFDPMNDDPAKSKANVHAIDATSGSYVWSQPTTKPAASHSGDFLAADVFFTGALDGKIRAYAAKDGALLWTSPAHGSTASALTVDGDTLIFGTGLPKMMGGNGGQKGVFAYRAPGGGARTASADVTTSSRSGTDSAATTQSASNADDPRIIEVIARDFRFDPERIEVRPGEAVAIKLVNKGSRPHNIEFELPSGEQELDQPVQPGQSATLRFTAPQKPGEYTSYCPVANHKERGMTATLIVRRG